MGRFIWNVWCVGLFENVDHLWAASSLINHTALRQYNNTTQHNTTQQLNFFENVKSISNRKHAVIMTQTLVWLGFRFSFMNHKKSWNKMVSHKMQSQKGILTYVRWLRLANITQRNARLDHTLYDYPIHIRDGQNHQNCLSKQ